MKSTLFYFFALPLLQLSSALSHGQHRHRHARRNDIATTSDVGISATAVRRSALPQDSEAADSGSGGCKPAIGGFGIAYVGKDENNQCKDLDGINQDFDTFKDAYKLVRIYDTGCPVADILSAAKQHNMKVMLGMVTVDKFDTELQAMIDAGKGHWDTVHSVAIGNEQIHQGVAADTITGKISEAKTKLQDAGYHGCIVTVDVVDTWTGNSGLCDLDFVAANSQPFFANIPASQTGEFMKGVHQKLEQACPGKHIVFTEVGWPTEGNANGAAEPSVPNARTSNSQVKNQLDGDAIFFEFKNEPWKKGNSADQWGVEANYGMYGKGYDPLTAPDAA
ncbi:MAG: hypothetical protein M1820_005751 [Bogoriella megaspora]|nr:MAG: hypothetical protein M1820_005751 [Bogoriella megaspora]